MDTGEIADICKKSYIELLVLFGSYASGKVRPTSDMNLAVKVRRGVEFSKLDLIYNLGGLFEGKDIDLVVLTRDMDPVLLKEIFFGEKLFMRNGPALSKKRN
jgi:predicted nucleotidyltransferase